MQTNNTSSQANPAGSAGWSAAPSVRAVRWAFCLAVIGLALWRFSENTADPDLWGHVLFGQRMLDMGGIEKTEPFSWTAPGHPWVNHEVGAELVLGAVHHLAGGTGLLLLMVFSGFLTIGLAIRLGAQDMGWPQRAAVWGLAGLLAKEIAFGFAARPQIFTAIGLALLLTLLRAAHRGRPRWLLLVPVLLGVWVNTHGGAVAGFCLLGLAAVAGTAQWLKEGPEGRTIPHPAMLWAVTGASLAALFCNPWGPGLLRWLVDSILWLRPEISEWNPPEFGIEHLPFFALIPISLFSIVLSRRRRTWWEPAILLALAVASLRLQRHIPLFCIAAVAIVPPHLADTVERFKQYTANLGRLLANATVQWALTVLFLAAAAAAGAATVLHNKRDFLTMEVPSDEYPVAAAEFIREAGLHGNLLVSFDWGEFAIWELPGSRVSMDGRLDTCYPHDLIREHWNFYEGKEVDEAVLDINKADFALIESFCPGITRLGRDARWKLVYRDQLACVWVRDPDRFGALRNLSQAATAPKRLLKSREPFPKSRATAPVQNPS